MAEPHDFYGDDFTLEQDFTDKNDQTLGGMQLTRDLGISVLASRLMIDAALSDQSGFLETSRRPGMVSIIEVPDQAWGADIAIAWRMIAGSVTMAPRARPQSSDDILEAATGPVSVWQKKELGRPAELLAIDPGKGSTKRDLLKEFRVALIEGRAVHAISHAPEALLPLEVVHAADQRLVIPPVDAGLLIRLAVDVCSSATDPIEAIPDDLIRFLQPSDLLFSRRPGQSAADFFRRVAATIKGKQTPSGPGLETLPGMGEASHWAHRLVQDLKGCVAGDLPASELDRGCVLEGPPGCGKTSLARAIAMSAGVPFLAASLQDWQGSKEGHLGSLLGAMAATFAEARRLAPCVLLIDEIDGIGDRSRFDARHRDYSRQVVNALLEQLDGSHTRKGIVVIGATNDATVLDPAILRPGRLERVIRVLLPDADGLAQILRHHLRGELRDEDLLPLAAVAYGRGASGADVERWCRVARATARRSGRPMVLDDLVAEIGEPPPPLSPGDLRRAAVHEAGHAVAYLGCGDGVLIDVQVQGDLGSPCRTMTRKDALGEGTVFLTGGAIQNRLRALLAGRAAELEVLGDISGGSGGSPTSDIAAATRLAVVAVAALGLDGHAHAVLWHRVERDGDADRLLRDHPDIRERVAALLSRSMAAACCLIAENRAAVLTVADALASRGRLTGEEVACLVGQTATQGAVVNQESPDQPSVDHHHEGGHPRGRRRSRADGEP
ncbi:AAA family ATPase [Muricoccus nepalensis]|uniref:AAA family ATPase n=1 Tax=Muricoccus nepalensis TaxID=1854500 RepID=UPI0013870984|nr:AAA family ATPase [Roseomonas nepalensis]